MTSSLDGNSCREVLSIAAPSVLNSELYTRSILVGLHVDIEYIVAFVKLVIATGNAEELAPGTCRFEVQGSVDDGRFTPHRIVRELPISLGLVGIEVHFLFHLDSGRLKLVELYLLDIQRSIGSLGLQDTVIVAADDTREHELIHLVASLNGNGHSLVVSITTPSVLDGQLYATSLFVRLHVEAAEVVTLRQLIITSGEDEELAPSSCRHKVQGSVDDRRLTAHGVVRELSVGVVLIALAAGERLNLGIGVDVQLLILHEVVKPLDGLLGMPCQGMAIDTQTSIGSGVHIVGDGTEVHRSIVVVDAGGHLHTVAWFSLVEVRIDKGIYQLLLHVVADGSTNTQLEVRIFLAIDILLDGLIVVQVEILSRCCRAVYHIVVRVELVGTRSHHEGKSE